VIVVVSWALQRDAHRGPRPWARHYFDMRWSRPGSPG